VSGAVEAAVTIPLEAGLEVIGDLHLDPADAEECARFAAWLGERRELKRLVVLGDLFDAWVGPGHARMEGAQSVIGALRSVASRGGAVDLLWGNRDFLLDENVAREAGARLCGEALVAVNEAGERTLFVHGDELCTLDTSYQRMRRVLRSSFVSGLLLRLPRTFTLWLARRLRSGSKRAVGKKAPEEMAMQVDVVMELARRSSASVVVCGHAHRWRDEQVGEGLRWVVLDAFGGEMDCLRVDEQGCWVGGPSGFDGGERG
jgi:UDP-2,3-diacylglucosamine hydrolase